jgi:hypothetical protein
MDEGTIFLWILSVGIVGGVLTWRHGRARYDEGFIDALFMHSEGQLTYTTHTSDDGVESMDIKFKVEDEE